MNRFIIAIISSMMIVSICMQANAGGKKQNIPPENKGEAQKMVELTLKSDAFEQGKVIPSKYTCDGQDISPALTWSAPPEGTKELVLICDDPDAPMGAWVHWVIWGISPDMTSLPEDFPKTDSTANGQKQGKNGFGKIGYGGPCPPRGSIHRYFFKLYAIDTNINLKPKATKWDLLNAIEGHVIGKGELMGKYQLAQ